MKKFLKYIGIIILVLVALANQLGLFGELMIALGSIALATVALVIWYRIFFTNKWEE